MVILILYLLVYYYFIRSYFGVDDDFVKGNIEYFLIGWFFGGLGLLSIIGSDYIRELDLLGPIFICIAVIIISRSFLKRKPEGTTCVHSHHFIIFGIKKSIFLLLKIFKVFNFLNNYILSLYFYIYMIIIFFYF